MLHESYISLIVNKQDEAGNGHIKEGIWLRSKSYSLLFADKTRKFANKGVQKAVAETISMEDYRQVLLTAKPTFHQTISIRSHSHQLYIEQLRKKSLSLFDTKRYATDRFSTLPFGHYAILK